MQVTLIDAATCNFRIVKQIMQVVSVWYGVFFFSFYVFLNNTRLSLASSFLIANILCTLTEGTWH